MKRARRWKDTPCRYAYREVWGVSAVVALRLIRYLRRAYPHSPGFHRELECERLFFIEELRRENRGT